MRLWHKDLITVLPRQQLLGQWRELNSIFKNQNKHVLINFIYDCTKSDLFKYSLSVMQEMRDRGYEVNNENFKKFFDSTRITFYSDNYLNKMNDRYLRQCLYNLQEKYDCGAITEQEWRRIHDKFEWYISY